MFKTIFDTWVKDNINAVNMNTRVWIVNQTGLHLLLVLGFQV